MSSSLKNRKNVTFEYKRLNTRDLRVDTLYQRDVDTKRVARIEKNYDPCLVNAVKVSYRNGYYYVFDGQHTVVCEKLRAGGKDVVIWCKVYYGLSRVDEMELFVAQNGESAAVNTASKFKALFNFGDKDIIGMVRGAEQAGVRVDFTTTKAPFKVTALTTLFKCYKTLTREQYIDMLTVLKKAWGEYPDAFCREILNAMTTFYTTYWGQFKSKELIRSLQQISPTAIVREGKSFGAANNTGSVYARILLRTYNKRRSQKRLEDKL